MACSQDNVESLWDDDRDTILNPNFAQDIPIEPGCRVDSIAIRIMKDVSGSGTMRIRIGSGPDPNNVTIRNVSSNVNIDDFPAFVNLDTGDPVTAIPLVTFDFPTPYTVESGEHVWALVERPSPTGNDPIARAMLTNSPSYSVWIESFGSYQNFVSGTYDLEYDLNGISEGTLYIKDTGFRFPYPRWT